MRDLASFSFGDLNAGVIEQETDCPIQFDFCLFVCGLGGDERDFGLGHGRLVLQHQR